jgi:hypothetical protein
MQSFILKLRNSTQKTLVYKYNAPSCANRVSHGSKAEKISPWDSEMNKLKRALHKHFWGFTPGNWAGRKNTGYPMSFSLYDTCTLGYVHGSVVVHKIYRNRLFNQLMLHFDVEEQTE